MKHKYLKGEDAASQYSPRRGRNMRAQDTALAILDRVTGCEPRVFVALDRKTPMRLPFLSPRLGWGGEKMILHGADIPADFVALSLPPSWGRARVGGLRAPGLDPSAVQVPTRGVRPPTLILPHTGGGDQTRNRLGFYDSSARKKNPHL